MFAKFSPNSKTYTHRKKLVYSRINYNVVIVIVFKLMIIREIILNDNPNNDHNYSSNDNN